MTVWEFWQGQVDYCNSRYHNLPKSQITRLQQIQNSLARAVVKAPKSSGTSLLLFPLVPSTHHSRLFQSRLKIINFWQILPALAFLFVFRTDSTVSRTVYRYFWAYPFLLFSVCVFHFLACFRAHVKVTSRLSYCQSYGPFPWASAYFQPIHGSHEKT